MAKLSFKKSEISTLSIPVWFIEKYMPKANGSFVKVYLYGLMCSLMSGVEVTNQDIAKVLDILESDVWNAWRYWQSVGIINTNENSGSFHIEFIDLPSPKTLEVPSPKTLEVPLQKKPTYLPKEIDIYITNNEEIRYLVNVAQEKLGKTLGPNSLSTLFSFYDWLRLPVEVIVMLLEYCASVDKRSLAYIEKVAIDWADKGINTVDKVEALLKNIEKGSKNPQFVQSKTAKNKFLNFSQEKPDFDELMKLAREKRIKDLKESRSS